MKFIFVDAENLSSAEIEAIEAGVTDKVLVFSRNETVRALCERRLFIYLSSYPAGPNQADFYIMSNLAGIIASLSAEQLSRCLFVLLSHDNALISAFVFQCSLHKARSAAPLKSKPSQNVATTPPSTPTPQLTLAEQILKQLRKPFTAEELRIELAAAKPEFTRAFNQLINEKKIQRSQSMAKNRSGVTTTSL